MPKTSLAFLKYADNFKSFRAGELIFREGEKGDFMYVVKAGTVELRVGNNPIETLDAGSILGEMALLDSESRSASAYAYTDCQIVPIDREKFQFLVKETPYFALEVMQIMAGRLRHMNRETSVLTRGMIRK